MIALAALSGAAPQADAAAAPRYRVDTVVDPDVLAGEIDALQRLADTAVEDNVFYGPDLLLPAMRAFATPALRIVLLRDRAGVLVGCAPLLRDRPAWGLGVARLQLWRPPHGYVCTPLIAAGDAAGVVEALLDWIAADLRGGLLDLHELPADGAVAQLFARALARWRWPAFATAFERALWRPGATLPARRAKDLRRLERRLAERGAVAFRSLRPGDDPAPWLERFLALEAGGWKGRRGTALATTARGRAFFVDAATAAHRRGRLSMHALELDGAAVAMQCNLLAGDGGYAFKVAYDERHADASPGLQLELHAMRHLDACAPPLAWLDSCARPDHALMNRLWPGRRRIVRLLVATGGVRPRLPVFALRIARELRRVWRRLARTARRDARAPAPDQAT